MVLKHKFRGYTNHDIKTRPKLHKNFRSIFLNVEPKVR
jgi:hypothetical protein